MNFPAENTENCVQKALKITRSGDRARNPACYSYTYTMKLARGSDQRLWQSELHWRKLPPNEMASGKIMCSGCQALRNLSLLHESESSPGITSQT